MIVDFILGIEGHVVPVVTIYIVIAGMVLLAVLDVWRYEVEDYATAALLVVAVVGVAVEGILPAQWPGAILAAAIAFMVYLGLGQRGVLGGGDVKLSIVPAFVLGASNPIVGLWWVACAIILHQVMFHFSTRGEAAPKGIPHVPAMAVATVIAAVAFPASL